MKQFWFLLSMGFALFAMHFGAGNLVFPLALGRAAGEGVWIQLIGLLLTAVLVPMAGFLSMMRFEGEAGKFFSTFGRIPGFLLMTSIVAVLCPLGAIPRCIAFTHAAFQELLRETALSIELFCFLACVLVFFMARREQHILKLLGKLLTPLLLLSLVMVLIGGFFAGEGMCAFSTQDSFKHLIEGLHQGYQTLDLLAALFFSGMLYSSIKSFAEKNQKEPFQLACLIAGIAGALLAATYIGFGFLAASFKSLLENTAPALLLIHLSQHVLGSIGGYVTLFAVIFACLTTAIALSAIFANFLKDDLFQKRIGYESALAITLGISYFVATLSFQGIGAFLSPILEVSYPVLIAVSGYNLLRDNKRRVVV